MPVSAVRCAIVERSASATRPAASRVVLLFGETRLSQALGSLWSLRGCRSGLRGRF